jgi:hypothetical protein
MPYLKASDGTIYLESDNPAGAWTPEEWAAEIAMREKLLSQLKDAQPIPKTKPDQECLDLWNSVMVQQPPDQIGLLEAELKEMKAV